MAAAEHRRQVPIVIEHFISHLLAQKAEAWVAAGQHRDPIRALDGNLAHLMFSFRYRLQAVLVCFTFGVAFGLFCWFWWTTPGGDFWLEVGYFGFMLPLFLVSGVLAASALTTRVTLSPDGFVVRRFGMDSAPIQWFDIGEVRWSTVTPTVGDPGRAPRSHLHAA
jgi:hypothetical protein